MFTAVACMLPTVVLLIVWIFNGGNVVEATMFEEVAKWVFMDGAITAFIALSFGYILVPFAWHYIYDKKGNDNDSID